MRNLLIFIFVFLIVILIGLFVNEAYAYEFAGYDLGDSSVVSNFLRDNNNIALLVDGTIAYLIQSDISPSYLTVDNVVNGYFYYNGSRSNVPVISINLLNGNASSTSRSNLSSNLYVASTFDVQLLDGGVAFPKNYSVNYEFKHQQKVSIYNPNSIMFSKFKFEKSNYAMTGTVLLLDENGQFLEQYDFSPSAPFVELLLPSGKTTNLIFNYYHIYHDEFLKLRFDEYVNNLDVEEYVPRYRISGQSTVKLNSSVLTGEAPYLKTNYTTRIIYQYSDLTMTYTKTAQLTANEPFYLPVNNLYLIKFTHEPTTTISVESNYQLQDTSERISILEDDELIDLIIDNGGTLTESQQPPKIVQIDRTKVVKLTANVSGFFTTFKVKIIGSSNSNAIISRYAVATNRPGGYIKLGEYHQVGNQGKFTVSVPTENGYIAIEENAGITTLEIDGKYKEGEDYTLEIIDKDNYVKNQDVEDSYHQVNPDPLPIEDSDDDFVKPDKGIFDDWFKGNDDDLPSMESSGLLSAVNTVKELLSVVVVPVAEVFKGIPEIYSLMILGFGLALVGFLIGR